VKQNWLKLLHTRWQGLATGRIHSKFHSNLPPRHVCKSRQDTQAGQDLQRVKDKVVDSLKAGEWRCPACNKGWQNAGRSSKLRR